MIQGGEEEPCRSRSDLRKFEATHGRPCPRVELEPGNGLAMELALASQAESTRAFLPHLLEAAPDSKRLDVVRRVTAALGSAAVNDQLRTLYAKRRESPPGEHKAPQPQEGRGRGWRSSRSR